METRADQIAAAKSLGQFIQSLLSGEFGHAYLTCCERHSHYEKMKDWADIAELNDDWVSEAERLRALETEIYWDLHVYPKGAVSSYRWMAASLEACIEAAHNDLLPSGQLP